MSEENVDLLRRAVDAYNRRDLDGLLEVLDPEIEWRPALPGVLTGEGAVYRGHDGIARMLDDFADVLEQVLFEVDDVREHGDLVVAIGRILTRGKASGAETVSEYACVGRIRDGKGVALKGYLDPAEALLAAGIAG